MGGIPLPLLPVAGKPVLQYQLEMLAKQGFPEVIVCGGPFTEAIRAFAGNGSLFGLRIDYAEEKDVPGNAGRLKRLEKYLRDDFLLLHADTLLYMDLNRLVQFHHTRGADATLLAQAHERPSEYDLLETDARHRLTGFHPRPHKPGAFYRNLADTGIYVFSPRVFDFIETARNSEFSDVFSRMLREADVYTYHSTEYVRSLSRTQDLESVATDIRSGRMKHNSYFYPQKAIFLDRDGVINPDSDFIKSPEEFELYPYTAAAIQRINQSGYAAVVVTNQSAVARNLCTEADLRRIHDKMETRLGEQGAKVDDIRYCPHHPDRDPVFGSSSYRIDCDCRKPKPGMLLQAADAFHISLADSFMIGDSDRDKEAGKRAGCITIGVRSGKGCADLKTDPDYLFEDLAESVDFILDNPLEKHLKTFLSHYEKCTDAHKPFVILLGGQPRSGKSTLASFLRIEFQKRNQRVLEIKADDWIMPAEHRSGKETVAERFRLKTFENDMLDLFNNEPISVQKYDSRSRSLREDVIYRYIGQDVVILDGAPLLHSQTLLNLADISAFTEVDETERRRRFERFYRWKGLSDAQIDRLYAERIADEFDFIARTAAAADVRIKN